MAHQLPSVLIILNSFLFFSFLYYSRIIVVVWAGKLSSSLFFSSSCCLGLSGANDETYWSLEIIRKPL